MEGRPADGVGVRLSRVDQDVARALWRRGLARFEAVSALQTLLVLERHVAEELMFAVEHAGIPREGPDPLPPEAVRGDPLVRYR